jgi:hypothetical protein
MQAHAPPVRAPDSDVGRPCYYVKTMGQSITIFAAALFLLAIAVIPAVVGA